MRGAARSYERRRPQVAIQFFSSIAGKICWQCCGNLHARAFHWALCNMTLRRAVLVRPGLRQSWAAPRPPLDSIPCSGSTSKLVLWFSQLPLSFPEVTHTEDSHLFFGGGAWAWNDQTSRSRESSLASQLLVKVTPGRSQPRTFSRTRPPHSVSVDEGPSASMPELDTSAHVQHAFRVVDVCYPSLE